jgi:uncharacterized repeat protein (TIGR01451 family)
MKTLLITILALVSVQLNAQTWVQVPDPNFQNYLTTHYPAGAFMNSGGNFYIDSDHPDVQAEDSLELSNLNLLSIEGAEAFVNLNSLNCNHNQLTELPDLPLGLKYLYCEYNQLLEIPVLPPSFLRLGCGNNQLVNLPNLPATMISLECNNNQLPSLPVLPNGLLFFECSYNTLNTLPALPTTLVAIECNSNQLTVLPELPPNLVVLYCGGNQLDSLPELPLSLEFLSCSDNWITELPALPLNLQHLICSQNPIQSLPLILPPNLVNLMCSNNQLTELPELPSSVQILSCGANTLIELPELPGGLIRLFCSSNDLTVLPELPGSLLELQCAGNQITCFGEFPGTIEYLDIVNNPFNCLPNYIPAMDLGTLAYPLCDINDPVTNPFGCTGATGIEGIVFADANSNCISSGQTLTYVPTSLYDSIGTLIKSSTSLANGDYYFSAVPGTYELSIDTANLTSVLHVTCPISNASTAILPASDTVVQGGDFGLVCAGYDLGIQSVVANGWVFPGEVHDLSILAGDLTAQYNMHCASGISGEVTIAVTGPGTVTFGGSPSNVSGNNAVYSIADFGATNANQFVLDVLTDTTAVSGDEFCVTVSVATNASGESDITNNLYSYCYGVVNSYDPNIKETYPETVEPGYQDEFTYTIHFQNTGSAPAFNIRLADTLDANLDLKTFKVVNASHEFTTTVNAASRLLTVSFPDIMLPDSTTHPQGSIGFIQYRVKPIPGLTNGTVIQNTAYIYFDYNAPIITNTTENVFFTDLGLGEWDAETIQLYPNPAENEFLVRAEREIDQITLSDINGKQVVSDFPHVKTTSVDVSDLKQGVYIVTIKTNQSVITKRLIVR